MPSPIGGGVGPDRGDPNANIVYFGMGGLGLPTATITCSIIRATRKSAPNIIDYLTFLLGKAGYADAAERAKSLYALEKQDGRDRVGPRIARNRDLTYNKLIEGRSRRRSRGDFPIERS